MKDLVQAMLDQKLQAARAVVERLERFEEQYRSSPELRAVIAELVSSVGTQAATEVQAPVAKPVTTPNGNGDAAGLTPAILDVVHRQPGIESGALIDAVLARVNSHAKKPRRNVSSTYDFLVKRGRLEKRGGRFYPVP